MQTWIERGAGLDVHKDKVVACWFEGQEPVRKAIKRTFGTFRWQLEQLRDCLLQHGCTHVAMESTGVYWKPVFNVLEGHFEIIVGNAQHMANVPGRKTDMSDAEWIATLLQYGLIKASFVASAEVRQLRDRTRFRRKLVQMRTASEGRVEKLLQSANIKISSVASELFGVSGRRMLRALAAGQSHPQMLADLARGRLRAKRARLEQALDGAFNADHARVLSMHLQMIDRIEMTISDLDRDIAQSVAPHDELIALLDTVPGIDRTSGAEILGEIGFTVRPWPSAAHFAAWGGTAPGNRESAGKRRAAGTRKGNPWLKTILVQAATSATRMRTSYLGRRFHQLAKRIGKRAAYVAIAHELAIAIYHIIDRRQPYSEPRQPSSEQQREQRKRYLLRQLAALGVEPAA